MVEQNKVVVNDIKRVFSSKKDIWLFVSFELQAFVPPEENCTIFYLKALADGSRSK